MLSLRVVLLMSTSVFTAFTSLCAQNSNSIVVQPIDFSDAVEKLVGLGFGDTKSASYVKIASGYSQGQSPLANLDQPPKLSGNAWFKSDPASPKTGTIILGYGQQAPFTVSTKNSSEPFVAGKAFSAKTQPADLKEDLAALLKWLVALDKNDDNSFGRSRYNNNNHGAPILAFAVMAHRSGHKEGANAIILKLLTSTDSPEAVIDSLISKIADQALTTALAKLTQDSDWKSYYSTLQEVDQTYQRGWDKHPGLQLLLPKAKLRADGDLKPVPKLVGIDYSDGAIAELKATLANPTLPATSYIENPLWLLNQKPALSSDKSPFNQLTELGMDGFIALVSLLDDDTLIIQEAADERNGYYSRNSYFNSHSDDYEELAYNAYSSIARPKTRGELAINYIQPYFKPQEDDYSSYSSIPDIAGLKSQALVWYKTHKDDSPITLAKYFLKNGSEQMVTIAVAHLISLDSEEANALIEEAILTAPIPSTYASSIKPYIVKRREAGSEFLKKYELLLLKELGAEPDFEQRTSAHYEIRNAGGVPKFISKLKKFTKPVIPKVLLTRLSRKDSKTTEILELLASQLKGKPLGELRPKYLYAAAKSEPQKASTIVQHMLSLETPKPISIEAAYAVELGSFESQDWKKLLEATPVNIYSARGAFHQVTAALMEKLFNPDFDADAFFALTEVLPETIFNTMAATRTTAILEQSKLPPLPTSDTIDEEQLRALVGKIGSTPPEEINSVVGQLSPSEFLAFDKYLDDEDPPESYSKARTLVHKVTFSETKDKIPNQEAIKALLESKKFIGKELTEGYIIELTELLKVNLKIFGGIGLQLSSFGDTVGFELLVSKIELRAYRRLEELESSLEAGTIDYYISLQAYSQLGRSPSVTLSSDPATAELYRTSVKESTGNIKSDSSCSFNLICATKDDLKKRQEELKKSRAPKEALLKKMAENPGGSVYTEHFEDQLDSITLEQLQSYYDRLLSNQ